MAAEIEFHLLGPLIVSQGGEAVTVPRGKQRVILAMLLLNAGRVVRLDELADALWASGPPPSGLVAVQNYVMRLRNTLGDPGRARIITRPPGYLIRVQAGELDLSRFEALLGAARRAARGSSWDQAATLAQEALQLWRGEPLIDIDSEALAGREASRLTELRLQTLELRIDADLHLGRHTEVTTELRQLVSAYPLRERLHSQLMLALYRDGRQAEALAAYRHARGVLAAELGVEPGSGLRDLHQRILSADPALTADPAQPAQAEPQRVTPRELPPTVPGFTGRSAELQTLTGLLDRPGEQAPDTVIISAIGGTAGVGKTNPEADTSNCYRGVRNARRSRNRYRPIRPGQSINSPGRWTGHRGSSHRIPCPSSRATQEVLGQQAPYVLGTVPVAVPPACMLILRVGRGRELVPGGRSRAGRSGRAALTREVSSDLAQDRDCLVERPFAARPG